MKKILLVALALCLSYGFAYSCLFNHSINLTTKMQNFETDSFTTKNGKSLKITFFKHASLLIEYAGKKFFIDPVSDYADFTQQPKADYILITHEHHDHFDTKAIAAIETPDTKIIANPNCQKMLDKGQAMKNGDILQITPEIIDGRSVDEPSVETQFDGGCFQQREREFHSTIRWTVGSSDLPQPKSA